MEIDPFNQHPSEVGHLKVLMKCLEGLTQPVLLKSEPYSQVKIVWCHALLACKHIIQPSLVLFVFLNETRKLFIKWKKKEEMISK